MKDKINREKLKRKEKTGDATEEKVEVATKVSAGAVDKAIDLAFNPTREKIREVTIIDRVQGRLFPLLDVINTGRQYVLEIAMHRENPGLYKLATKREKPVSPNLLDEYMYRTAQWQKSVQGTNLTKITDIALAETEARIAEEEEEPLGGKDLWAE